MKPANPIIHSFILIIILNICLPLISTAGTVNLPQTGQTTCYDTSGSVIPCTNTGQDGDIRAGVAWPNPRFTDNSDGTMTDNLSGLMWTQDANLPAGTKTWKEALDYVAGMNAGSYLGYTDWRLPNVNELESLVNAKEANSATWLNGQGFINVQSNSYWSSTGYAPNTSLAWYVTMINGLVGSVNNFVIYVWPVRSLQKDGGQAGGGGSFGNSDIWKTGQTTSYATGDDGDIQAGVAWPSPRFRDNGDSTITDNLTGLMWKQDADLPAGRKIWQEALDYVAGMNAGSGAFGYTDWRLPNRKELFSLIDRSQHPPLPAVHPFTNVQSSLYWSSTSYAVNTGRALSVSMFVGSVQPTKKSNSYYVWPVRSGSGGSFGNSDISVSPNSKDFGNVNISVSSSPQGFTISNTGNADLIIGTISLTGTDASEFNIQNDTCTGTTITLSATCTLDLVFSSSTGGVKSANLSIPSNDPDTPTQNVPLSGTGIDLDQDGELDMTEGLFYYDSDEVAVVTNSQGLSPPTGVTASVNGTTVTINWNTVNGAERYMLYYGFSSGEYSGTFDLGNSSNMVFNNISEGTYYLVITAYAGTEKSGYSDEASVTVR